MSKESSIVRVFADFLLSSGYKEDQLIIRWTFSKEFVFDLAIIDPASYRALAVFMVCPNKKMDTVQGMIMQLSKLENKFQSAIFIIFPSFKTSPFEVFQLSLIDGIKDLRKIERFPDFESLIHRMKPASLDNVELEIADPKIRTIVKKDIQPEVGIIPINNAILMEAQKPASLFVSEFEEPEKAEIAKEVLEETQTHLTDTAESVHAQVIVEEQEIETYIPPIKENPNRVLYEAKPSRGPLKPERVEIQEDPMDHIDRISDDKLNKILVYLYRKEKYKKLIKSKQDIINLAIGGFIGAIFLASLFNIIRISTGTAVLMATTAYFLQQYLVAKANKD